MSEAEFMELKNFQKLDLRTNREKYFCTEKY